MEDRSSIYPVAIYKSSSVLVAPNAKGLGLTAGQGGRTHVPQLKIKDRKRMGPVVSGVNLAIRGEGEGLEVEPGQ